MQLDNENKTIGRFFFIILVISYLTGIITTLFIKKMDLI